MNDRLGRNIIKTLAYFDLFNMPLSSHGVHEYMYWPEFDQVALSEVEQSLQSLVDEKILAQSGDLFFLADRDAGIVANREQARQRSVKLIKNARPWLSFIAGFPGVEMIAICNTMAWLNAGQDSDIDLFIITKPNQIWQTRFAIASFLQFFKKRPQPGFEYGKLCVSFLVSSDALDIRSIALENDIYLAYWFRTLMSVYDPQNILSKFMGMNLEVFKQVAKSPDDVVTMACPIDLHKGLLSSGQIVTKPIQWWAHTLENKAKRWQTKRFPPAIRNAAKFGGSDVIVNDQMLKFHTNDRRQFYRDAWVKRYEPFL